MQVEFPNKKSKIEEEFENSQPIKSIKKLKNIFETLFAWSFICFVVWVCMQLIEMII